MHSTIPSNITFRVVSRFPPKGITPFVIATFLKCHYIYFLPRIQFDFQSHKFKISMWSGTLRNKNFFWIKSLSPIVDETCSCSCTAGERFLKATVLTRQIFKLVQ